MKPYGCVYIEHPQQLLLLSQHLELFVFRGQADANWELVTSLERAFRRSGSIYSLENTEYWMIHDFSNKFHLYSSRPPKVSNKFEWMALMQHYGGATRLLDFTESLYVAAYFSVLRSTTDSAIWALNRPLLRDNLFKTGKLSYKPKHDLKDIIDNHHIDLFNKHVARQNAVKDEDCVSHLIPLESQSLFDRASRQQSLFVAAGYLGDISSRVTYMDNLFSSFPGLKEAYAAPATVAIQHLCTRVHGSPNYDQFATLKIVIPHKIHRDLRQQLSLMGLSEETLFPGLDGLARGVLAAHI
jgi:hypothetical protein